MSVPGEVSRRGRRGKTMGKKGEVGLSSGEPEGEEK